MQKTEHEDMNIWRHPRLSTLAAPNQFESDYLAMVDIRLVHMLELSSV